MKRLANAGGKKIETKARSIKVWTVLVALVLAVAMLTPHPVAASAATVYATINGGGTAYMEDGMGTTVFGMGIKLYSDGSATGEFQCLDQHGSAPGYPGIIWGKVTSWNYDVDGTTIVLHVMGKFHSIPGGPGQPFRNVPFTVKIQTFGGAGVGHWTLAGPDGVDICFEILTSGQIVIRYAN